MSPTDLPLDALTKGRDVVWGRWRNLYGMVMLGHARRMESGLHETPARSSSLKLTTLILATLAAGVLAAQEARVTSFISKELKESPGKEGLMILVEYPPGSRDPIHRHNAHAFAYALEGSIVMQVKGGKQVTLTAGQTSYEGPDDEHIVGRNASNTKPARFVVFLVKDKGAPILVPTK